MSFIKWFLIFCLVFVVATGHGHAAQSSWARVADSLAMLEGDWYDGDEKLALSIHDGKINGYPVLSAENGQEGLIQTKLDFRVATSSGAELVRLEWFFNQPRTAYLLWDGYDFLHRGGLARESVDGVYIGMSKRLLEKVLGQPTAVVSREDCAKVGLDVPEEAWFYSNECLFVTLPYGSVDNIYVLNDSPAKFIRARLSAQDSLEDFEKLYGPRTLTGTESFCHTGSGETIYFGPNYVKLSAYPPQA